MYRRSKLLRTCLVVSSLVMFTLLVPSSSVIPKVSANPVAVGMVGDGFVIPSSQDVQMPTANVSIDAVITGSFVYGISMDCSFELVAEQTANCTIAFVYPGHWTESGTIVHVFEIHVDSLKVNHSLVDYDELSFTINTSSGDVGYFQQCSHAVFNTTFTENQTRDLDVQTSFTVESAADYFEFRYAVGSGRYWTGQTHEVVTIEVDDQAGLLGLGFRPEPSTLTTVSETVRVATWSIDVDLFSSFWVWFLAHQKDSALIPPPSPETALLLSAMVIVVFVAVVIRFRH